MTQLLLVDDDPDYREMASLILVERGFEVIEASCAKEAFDILLAEPVDAVVSDLLLPFSYDSSNAPYVFSFEVGVRLLRELHEAMPALPLIALSSTPQEELRRIMKFMSPIRAFQKPSHPHELIVLIEELLSEGMVAHH